MEASSPAESSARKLSVAQPGHKYVSARTYDQARRHVDQPNIILPENNQAASIKSFGLCLGNAPQIGTEAFKGRENELKELHNCLLQASHNDRRITSIVGAAGIGKTQLSLAYARRYGHQYSSVFWLSAVNESILRRELVLLHEVIFPGSSSTATRKPEGDRRAVERVMKWLSEPENDRWLLIFDNYDSPDFQQTRLSATDGFDIRHFFPGKDQGHIIITTRHVELFFSRQLHLEEIENITTRVTILSQRSRRDLQQDPEADYLAKLLGGIPLTLATVGAHLAFSGVSCAEYRRLYECKWKQLFDNTDPGLLAEYPETKLFPTWSIWLDHMRARHEDVAKLLEFMAFFNSGDVWYELLAAGVSDELPWLARVTKTEVYFQQVISELHDCCLIEVVGSSFQFHPYLHSWLKQQFPGPQEKCMFIAASTCIIRNEPDPSSEHFRDQCCRMSAHVKHLSAPDFMKLWESYCDDGQAASIAREFGNILLSFHLFGQANILYQLVLPVFEKTLGPKNAATLNIMGCLGTSYRASGEYDKAEHWFLRMLASWRGTHYQEDEPICDILTGVDDLLDQQTMAENKQTLLGVMCELCLTHRCLSKLAEAHEIQNWLPLRLERLTEVDDQQLITIMHNLSTFTRRAGLSRSDVVGRYIAQTWALAERELASDTRRSLLALSCLGRWYHGEGHFFFEEKALKRAWQGMDRLLGAEDILTRHTLYDLSTCYSRLGRLDEADETFTRAQAGRGYEVSQGDIWSFHAARWLGDRHMEQGNLERAEKLSIYAYDGMKDSRGQDDHDTMEILYTLSLAYIKMGRHQEAYSLFQRIMVIYEGMYGPEPRAQVFKPNVDVLSSFFANTAMITDGNNESAATASANTTDTTTEVQASPRPAPQFPKSIAALRKVIEPAPQSSSDSSYWPTWMYNLISLNRSKPADNESCTDTSSGEKNEKNGGG